MKQYIVFVMLITWAWSCAIGVWKYPALNLTIYFHRAFVVKTRLVGFALQRVKKKSQVYYQKPLQKQHNTMMNGVEKSSRNGSSDGRINVQCYKLLEWPSLQASSRARGAIGLGVWFEPESPSLFEPKPESLLAG